MDLRQKKTLSAIKNAFIELRAKRPLEKISVKELTEVAEISKATFYLHYQDVYDLSESLQNDTVENVFSNIEHPEYIYNNTAEFTRELFNALAASKTLIDILFADNQALVLPMRIEEKIKHTVIDNDEMLKDNEKARVLLTYAVQGGYSAYNNNRDIDIAQIIDIIADFSSNFSKLIPCGNE